MREPLLTSKKHLPFFYHGPLSYPPKMESSEARIGSGFTSLMGMAWLFNHFYLENDVLSYVVIVAFGDFFLRLVLGPLFSPLGLLSKILSYVFPPNRCSSVPKRRAYFVGSLFTAISAIAQYLGYPIVSVVCLGMLTIFSFAEAAFSFCVLCVFIKAIAQYRKQRLLTSLYSSLEPHSKPFTRSHPPVDKSPQGQYDYDLVFIGGGSAGMAGCLYAKKHYGLRIAVIEYHEQYGVAGTCATRGCIPKIQIHEAASLKRTLSPAFSKKYGFNVDYEFDWSQLMSQVQNNTENTSVAYTQQLESNGIDLFRGFGSFVDPHTVEISDPDANSKNQITGRRIIVSVGGRPNLPKIGGIEHAITSDDFFKLKTQPKSIVVVGAGFIALELSTLLAELGTKVTVMVRNTIARGFDKEIVEKITQDLEEIGVEFVKASPVGISKTEDGLSTKYEMKDGSNGTIDSEMVLFATGRTPNTDTLNLENAGVTIAKNGKIPTINERTNVDHIYAVGDVVFGIPELTPVAIQSTKLLLDRLYGGKLTRMNYANVATTMFLTREYGSVGLSEEKAKEVFGKDNVTCFVSAFTPAYWAFVSSEFQCFVKIVVHDRDDRVVGIHLLSPRFAGEVMQGFSSFINCKGTKQQLDLTTGIHPTLAEQLNMCTTIKGKGNAQKTSC
ncbi:hypothetical protein P9112_006639 [Eukaryota sp. TZLM1-RC]